MDPRWESQLRTLVDESQIRSVVHRYCRAIDRRQYDDLRRCYHPDGTDHHGDFYGTVDRFVDYVRTGLDQFERTLHFIGNLEVEVQGARARSEAYVLALARLAADGGRPARDNLVALRYVDDFERRDEWRIARRVCVYEWTRTDPVPDGWSLPDSFLRGRRNHDDVVFLETLAAPSTTSAATPRDI